MSRTKRGVAYKHYWGSTKEEAKKFAEEYDKEYFTRWYLLHGTDAKNWSPHTHYYFNIANRVGRRIARDSLRPHLIMDEDYDFDDARYLAKYKGVWWDIY